MSAVLMSLAVALTWWPTTRAEYRLAVLGGHRTRSRHLSMRVVGLWAAPVAALVMIGAPSAAATAMVAATLGWRWRATARREVDDRRDRDLLLALAVLIAELSVGAPPARAAGSAARELAAQRADSPVAAELSTMAGRAELGGEVLTAADDGPVAHRIGVAWQSAERHGLPLGELLESVRADLLARRQFADRTRAGLAGPRATAAVLAGLPVLGILLGEAMGAHPLGVLTDTGLGGVLLVAGTGLSIAGLVWAERITGRAAQP
ncbi:type II secretion system F family protein [Gordonia sp. CPCC 206044]|uniref:type II secretion system F family protein n=1 Tax=Gordonia sp. CPCC 206044 TaxID=3140793 RepID=UPI003AF38EAD